MQSDKAQTPKRPRKIKPAGADGHRGRMFDKFLAAGNADVLPRDIIEMLLYFSIRVRDTRDSAVELMEHFNGDINSLLDAPSEELQAISGIGESSAMLLGVVGCIAKRLEENDINDRHTYVDTAELGELFSQRHTGFRNDVPWAAFLDNSMRIISIEQVKDAPLTADGNDMFVLISLAAKYHSSVVAVARMSHELVCYPTMDDLKLAKHIDSIFHGANLTLAEYFVVTPDDSFAIKKMYQ